MPSFGNTARRLIRTHDVVHLHLPQFDGAGLAINARRLSKPVVLTYHCDIQLPPGPLNALAGPAIRLADRLAARYADRLVAYTEDYARHSPFLSRHAQKLQVIPPPVEIDPPARADVEAFAGKWGLNGTGRPVIGMVARLATEKGVEVLAQALGRIRQMRPGARVLFAGPYRNVLGEEAYARRLQSLFEAHGPHWTFTGSLQGAELAAFYASCDVTVLPSLNSTESFGLVQVESMLCGTPSICSNLPGVRVAVETTGMGIVVPIGDSEALSHAVLDIVAHREKFIKPRSEISRHYNTERSMREYEALYQELMTTRRQNDG